MTQKLTKATVVGMLAAVCLAMVFVPVAGASEGPEEGKEAFQLLDRIPVFLGELWDWFHGSKESKALPAQQMPSGSCDRQGESCQRFFGGPDPIGEHGNQGECNSDEGCQGFFPGPDPIG